jgi:hypothetical protein
MDKHEKRRNRRRPIKHIVHIATGVGPPLQCQMIDVSESGARLIVDDPKSAPETFLIMLNDNLLRWCQVMWRSNTQIGIKFVNPLQSSTTKKPKPRRNE